MPTTHSRGLLALTICSLGLAGCASMPPSQDIQYYYPKAQTRVEVIQTIGCAKASKVVSDAQVVVSTTYSADTQSSPQPILFSDFGSALDDPDVDVTFTDDGRLKGLSANTTGEGGTVVKGAATIAIAAMTFALDGGKGPTSQVTDACTTLDDLIITAKASDPKVLTLIYTSDFQYDQSATSLLEIDREDPTKTVIPKHGSCKSSDEVQLLPDVNSQGFIDASHGALSPYSGPFCLRIDSATSSEKHPRSQYTGGGASSSSHFFTLRLRPVQNVVLQVYGPEGTFLNEDHKVIWSGLVSVPKADGQAYSILVPSGAFFGSERFSLALADDGSITEIHYSASGGASDFTGAVQGIAQAYPNKETQLQNENDLIYQQQRHVICVTNPPSCPSK